MTLDEAIKNEEEIAIQQIEKANALDNIPLFGMSKDDIEEIKECYKCSKEHEQLAEWLKDYKRLLKQEPCEDAISRQAVLDLPRIKTHNVWGNVIKESVDVEDIRRLSSVNLQEPKTGHWIVHPKDIYAHLVCDKCLSNAPYDCRTNYCPNCGAKME